MNQNGVRKIIDSNFLQREELKQYLSKSEKNFAVLTDYAFIEAYKKNSLISITKSMEILSLHPNQVIILKGTQSICGLRGRRAGVQRRMIDFDGTKHFPQFCNDIKKANQGNLPLQQAILEHGKVAEEHMNRMLTEAEGIPAALQDVADSYEHNELQAIRKYEVFDEKLKRKIMEHIMIFAFETYKNHPKVSRIPDREELLYSFIFRNAVCSYLFGLNWIAVGGAQKAKPEKIRNDMVDISFATYATYFDDILTADQKLFMLYRHAKIIIDGLISQST